MHLSIVIPVFNSSNILNNLIKQIKFNLKFKEIKKFEIILVNDCSQDNSWNKIKELSKKNLEIKGINLSNNYGQHSSIFAGLKYAKGKIVITMDDDLQHPPSGLISIYKKLNECDLCYTLYITRKHARWKKLVSQINNIFSSFLFNKPFHIYLSSFRGFKAEIKNKIIKHKKPIIFLDSLLLKASKKTCTISVKHKKRFKGESNYNISNLFSLWFDMIENYHFLPLRFGSLIGLISFLLIKLIRFYKNKKNVQFKIKEKTF